jgi:hypothetical protein
VSLPAPAPLLPLPHFGADVPSVIRVVGNDTATAEIAEAALRLAMLREEDWGGEIVASVKTGLDLWTQRACGFSVESRPSVHLVYSTDWPAEWVFDKDDSDNFLREWREQKHAASYLPVAMVGLEADAYTHIFVEYRILALEDVCPGAGFHLLALIDRALWWTVGGVTPAWCHNRLEEWAWDYDEVDADAHGIITPDKFTRQVPAEACRTEFDPAVFSAALRRHPDAELRDLLEAALALVPLVKPLADDSSFFQMEQVLPVAVRWSEDDRMDEISDEYHDMIANDGLETRLCFLRCFQSDRPDEDPLSAHAALCAAERACRIVGAVSDVLQMLGDSEPCRLRQRVRV